METVMYITWRDIPERHYIDILKGIPLGSYIDKLPDYYEDKFKSLSLRISILGEPRATDNVLELMEPSLDHIEFERAKLHSSTGESKYCWKRTR